jgi:hypothetical protein
LLLLLMALFRRRYWFLRFLDNGYKMKRPQGGAKRSFRWGEYK